MIVPFSAINLGDYREESKENSDAYDTIDIPLSIQAIRQKSRL